MTRKNITFLLVIGILLVLAFARITKAFSGAGSGTELDPYIITNVNQLQEMNDNLEAWYELNNNINASDTRNWNGGNGFLPVGNNINKFEGHFDGKEHTITGLFIDRRTTEYVGLFGYVYSTATIKDVTLEDLDIKGKRYTGGLVGVNHGDITNSHVVGYITGYYYQTGGLTGIHGTGDINNSSFTGTVVGVGTVGGLAGGCGGGATISNSYATGNVISTSANAGGLIGSLGEANVSNSYAVVNVTGTNYVGGLVGRVFQNNGNVSNSYATGNVIGTGYNVGGLVGANNSKIEASYATGEVTGDYSVGGLVGWNGQYCDGIFNSYATGKVTSAGDNVGGLVGYNGGKIEDSYATGNVTGDSEVGGLVGLIYWGTTNPLIVVTRSHATGNVIGNYSVGGLVGNNSKGEVSNSYAIGTVVGIGYVGGLIGKQILGGTLINSYSVGNVVSDGGQAGGLVGFALNCIDSFWDVNTSGQDASYCGTGKSTVEMKQQSTFTNWDFVNIWGILENATYPFLKGTPEEPVVTGFLETEPLSWTSANRIDVSANLNQPELKVDSYVLSTSAPDLQVSYTKHEFVEDDDSVSWNSGTAYVADQVAKNNLFAIADPVSGLVPLHCVTTTSHAQGSFHVEATGPLDTATVAVDITIPSSVEGYGSTVVDRPDALLRAAYQVALVALHMYDQAAFDLAKDAISMGIESKTGISVILPPYNPMNPIDWFDALFMHTVCEALDRAYESEFQAKTQVRFQCPLAQFPETGEPLSELSQDYGYTKPTQDFFARFEKSGMLKLNRTIEVPTNTDVVYTIDIKAIAASWGIAQALAHTQGYTIQFKELSTQQTITQSTVILNAPKPEIWPDPELDFQFDAIGDIHATHSLEDNLGQPVIIPTEGNEFIVMLEHSSCLYLVSVPLSLTATDISIDLDVLLSDSLDSVGQKKLLISAVDSENNTVQLVDKDLNEYTYTEFGPAEGFTQHTGFFNVSSDVSSMAGKDVTLMFLLMGKSNDPNRAGLIIDNIQGFAAPVPKASNGDLDDNGEVDFGDYAVFARHWLDTGCSEPNWCEWADLDFDTSVDLADLEIFSGYWLWKKSEPIQGDFNQSKFVDFADFVILANRWMNSCVDPHWCDGCDFDESGKVDINDLGEFSKYWLWGPNP